ncbi:MAG: VWA domain-containing protein [Parvularculaceae bacterium]
MFATFFHELRAAGVPASLREYLTLIEALEKGAVSRRVEDFYYVARAALVKDERAMDKFDVVFARVFKGVETVGEDVAAAIPEDWLKLLTQKYLTDEEKREIEALGGWEKLMETLMKRLEEQKGRHSGGSKWIGTGGTSPFGAGGYNPEGVRIGDAGERQGRAVKVWEKREFANLRDDVELGVRNMKVALRKLREFARDGAAEEFDLNGTIDATARGGFLDVKLRPERRNAVKVLLLFDVGGSMDPFVEECERLFSAARAEFKRLDYYYFHNCVYGHVWPDNRRRWSERVSTLELMRTHPADTRVIFVGDASMSPYEIVTPGGSGEGFNDETGAVWLDRLLDRFKRAAWINPTPSDYWGFTPSVGMIRQLMGGRMAPLTLAGLDEAVAMLRRGAA